MPETLMRVDCLQADYELNPYKRRSLAERAPNLAHPVRRASISCVTFIGGSMSACLHRPSVTEASSFCSSSAHFSCLSGREAAVGGAGFAVALGQLPDGELAAPAPAQPDKGGGGGREGVQERFAVAGLHCRNFVQIPKGVTVFRHLVLIAVCHIQGHVMMRAMRRFRQSEVSARTPEGRRIRRRLLRGCVLVFITSGYSGKRFIYEKAHELGIRCARRDSGPCSAANIVVRTQRFWSMFSCKHCGAHADSGPMFSCKHCGARDWVCG